MNSLTKIKNSLANPSLKNILSSRIGLLEQNYNYMLCALLEIEPIGLNILNKITSSSYEKILHVSSENVVSNFKKSNAKRKNLPKLSKKRTDILISASTPKGKSELIVIELKTGGELKADNISEQTNSYKEALLLQKIGIVVPTWSLDKKPSNLNFVATWDTIIRELCTIADNSLLNDQCREVAYETALLLAFDQWSNAHPSEIYSFLGVESLALKTQQFENQRVIENPYTYKDVISFFWQGKITQTVYNKKISHIFSGLSEMGKEVFGKTTWPENHWKLENSEDKFLIDYYLTNVKGYSKPPFWIGLSVNFTTNKVILNLGFSDEYQHEMSSNRHELIDVHKILKECGFQLVDHNNITKFPDFSYTYVTEADSNGDLNTLNKVGFYKPTDKWIDKVQKTILQFKKLFDQKFERQKGKKAA